MSYKNCGLSIALLLLISCVPVFAQGPYTDRLGGHWNNPASAMITNIVLDRMARRRLAKRLGVPYSGPGSTARTSASTGNAALRNNSTRIDASVNDAQIRFRSTGTQLKTREIANQLGGSDGEQQTYEILNAVLQAYEKEARRIGKPNDLALALSFFFASNATVYHDTGLPADPQVMELRDVIANALVEADALNGVTDRQKQEMYETLILYAGLARAGYREAKANGDAASLNIYRQLAGMNLQAVTGISPDKITFTGEGLNIDNGSIAAAEVSASESAVPVTAAIPPPAAGAIEWFALIRQYEDNEVAADDRYTGKRIRVTGPFEHAEMENGKMMVWFETPAQTVAHLGGYFPNSQRSAVAALTRGQKIVVECISRGLSSPGRLTMDTCVIK